MERFVIRKTLSIFGKCSNSLQISAKRRQIEKLLLEQEGKLKEYDEDHKK